MCLMLWVISSFVWSNHQLVISSCTLHIVRFRVQTFIAGHVLIREY